MAENPYEPPTTLGSSRKTPRRGAPVMFIVVVVAMLPAAFIAFFTICAVVIFTPELGTGSANEGVSKGIFAGLIGAAVVLGLMVLWAIALKRRSDEPVRVWTDTDGKKLEASLDWRDEKEVLLRTRDGKEVRVAIEKLCAEDREWLKERG